MEDGNGDQQEQGETGSDADTDELLTNADMLCSGASDKQGIVKPASSPFHTPIKPSKSDHPSSSSKSSVRRSLNFDIDQTASERKRQSKVSRDETESSDLDRSQSCPSTPKVESKINGSNGGIGIKKVAFSPASKQGQLIPMDQELRSVQISAERRKVVTPFSIPVNSFAIVQFAKAQDIGGNLEFDLEETSICEKHVESLKTLLISAKTELINASQLIQWAMGNQNGNRPVDKSTGQSISTSLSIEERSFMERLSATELGELYEAEFCKRRYCEKKIDILQKQLLDLEQKLSVATVSVDRFKNVVGNVEEQCNEFVTDVTRKEEDRTRMAVALKRNNEQLKTALERVIAYGQMLGEKMETCNQRVQSLEKDLDDRSMAVANLEMENGKLKDESSQSQAEVAALKKKLEQSEAKRKASFEREEQLTKELLAMERTGKDNVEIVQKMKNELNQEKATRRSQLEEKDRQYKERISDLAKDFDSRVEKTRHEIEQRTATEMKKLKDEWDSVLYGLSEKYGRMVNERDEALRRLKEYEDTFSERQRIMCYELQQRLSAKYYELLSEFSPPGLPSSSSTNGNNATDQLSDIQMGNHLQAIGPMVGQYANQGAQAIDPSWFSSCMAEEFLERIRNAYPPGATPRHLRQETPNKDHKQAPSVSVNQRAVPPQEGQAKKK